jgi:acetylornithine deacetylase
LLVASREIAQLGSWLQLPEEHELLGISTIVPTVLRAGERHNTVPSEASLVLDARLAPPYTGEDCLQLLSRLLPGASLSCRSDRLRARETAASHPLVQHALAAAGKSAAIGSRTLSDMALLAGIPAIKCGPGETARSHTANEWITEAELIEGARFYEQLVPAALAACSGART